MLLDDLARRRSSHIHGNVAAADNNDFLADGELVAKVYVEQEIDALMHAVEINAGDAQIAASMCSHCDQDGVESLLPEIGNLKVTPGGVVQLKGDIAGLKNLADLRLDHIARQPVLRNSEIEHASGNRRSFEDG